MTDILIQILLPIAMFFVGLYEGAYFFSKDDFAKVSWWGIISAVVQLAVALLMIAQTIINLISRLLLR